MSVIESVKAAVGLEEQGDEYHCHECDHTFESDPDSDTFWVECPECGRNDDSDAVELVE